ncbi:MAG: hypothetical protein ACPLUL_14140 [Thermanaerothrix sp.]|uniref:hypothetical protein n=1 Tax=Thermanaerothrix sp. TaxID=2972675 RepID=UPI003C7E6B54
MEVICGLPFLIWFIIWAMIEERKSKNSEIKRQQNFYANYYFYQRTHPYNHDGNPFNDLPGASHIYGTDSYFHHHHWGP